MRERLARESDEKEGASGFVNKMNACIDDVTEKQVANLNKIFESKSPSSLVDGMQAFVALLRNNNFTQSVDVELFFKDSEKLKRKMQRVKTTDVDLGLAVAKLEELEKLRSKFEDAGPDETEDNVDLSEFACFVNWSINYCQAAKIDLRVQATQAEVAELEARKEKLDTLSSRFRTMNTHTEQLGFASFFDRAASNVQTRSAFLEGVTETDRNQA